VTARGRRGRPLVIAAALLGIASAALAQAPAPETPEGVEIEAPPLVLTPLSPAITPPGVLIQSPGLLRESILPPGTRTRPRGPVVLTPSLTVTEEFNDNVFLDNRRKRSDFITGFTPGLSLTMESATYRLTAAGSFTAEVYAKETDLNDAASRQSATLDGLLRLSPRLTLTLVNVYSFDNNTNIASVEGISTGRTETSSNTLAPGIAYELDRLTTLRLRGAWSRQRFDSSASRDSDTYRIEPSLARRLTPRLTGTLGYEFAYFDVQLDDDTTTHTPRVGLDYRVTRTLTAAVQAGPQIATTDGDTSVNPSVRADLTQQFAWGWAGVSYDRGVATAGGLGGTTESDAVTAQVRVTTLLRGLVLGAGVRYARSESDDSRIDVDAIGLNLQAAYQLTRWLSVVGAYTFFHQRNDGTRATADVDQNRVFLGLQAAYPIAFD
jgi:predicted porin